MLSCEIQPVMDRSFTQILSIQGSSLEAIGSGLYLDASAIDHSCSPNATRISDGKNIIIRTIENNVKNFNDLRFSYLPKLYERTIERRIRLMKSYYFLCDCPNCQDSNSDKMKSSLKCLECKDVENSCIPIESGICFQCNFHIDKSKEENYKNLKKQFLNLTWKPGGDNYENLFKEAVLIFHPYDKDFMDFLQNYYKLQRTIKNNYSKCYQIMNLILKNYRKNLPKNHLNIGLSEMITSKYCIRLNKLDEAEIHIKNAEEIFLVTHGKGHSIITGDCQKIREDINLIKSLGECEEYTIEK